jgi:hypothetical protein
MRKNPKRFWSVYKNKKKSLSIPTTVASEAFNTYFHSVISLDDSSISHLHEVQQTCDLTASDSYTSSLQLEVSVEEVEKLLHEIDPTKVYGPDAFPSLVLKECASEHASSACKLFNKSISSGTFPQQWKEAVVVPIHKKGDRNFVMNYRPISLLCILSKVLERCVFNRLIGYLSHSLSEH